MTCKGARAAGVDIMTFGQYLQPTPAHLEVAEYVPPEKFEHWRRYGEEVVGFRCALYGLGSTFGCLLPLTPASWCGWSTLATWRLLRLAPGSRGMQ